MPPEEHLEIAKVDSFQDIFDDFDDCQIDFNDQIIQETTRNLQD